MLAEPPVKLEVPPVSVTVPVGVKVPEVCATVTLKLTAWPSAGVLALTLVVTVVAAPVGLVAVKGHPAITSPQPQAEGLIVLRMSSNWKPVDS